MLKRVLLAGAAVCLYSTGTWATNNAPCPNISGAQLQSALQSAIRQTGGALGLGLNMWATVVAPDGVVCLVVNSSNDAWGGQWLASRVISAQKAFTAVSLSLGPTAPSGSGTPLADGRLALSTANLYSAVQPGGSLFGLSSSNPVAGPEAYGDMISPSGVYVGPFNTAAYGTASDPMIGLVIGGINTFGGGLELYGPGGTKAGGVGVSGDTSCTDHLIAWNLRHNVGYDHLASIAGVSGDSQRPDNIVFDITPNPYGGTGVSAGGFGHPTCLANSIAVSTAAAKSLPPVIQ